MIPPFYIKFLTEIFSFQRDIRGPSCSHSLLLPLPFSWIGNWFVTVFDSSSATSSGATGTQAEG
jgi:hypothetical protein